jgi:hypothetical protein
VGTVGRGCKPAGRAVAKPGGLPSGLGRRATTLKGVVERTHTAQTGAIERCGEPFSAWMPAQTLLLAASRDRRLHSESAKSSRLLQTEAWLRRTWLACIPGFFVVRFPAECPRSALPAAHADPVKRLDAVPGIGPRIIQILLAEIGPDPTRFHRQRIWPPGLDCALPITRVPATSGLLGPVRATRCSEQRSWRLLRQPLR